MDAEYIKKIQRWVQLDNKVLEMQEQLKPLQEDIKKIQEDNKDLLSEKEELESDIVAHIHDKKLDMLTINTSDGSIKFSKKNNTQSLSIKLLRTLLQGYQKEHEQVNGEDIINYIVNNLEKKTKLSIKRSIN